MVVFGVAWRNYSVNQGIHGISHDDSPHFCQRKLLSVWSLSAFFPILHKGFKQILLLLRTIGGMQLDKVIKSQVQGIYPRKFLNCDSKRILRVVLVSCVRIDKKQIDFGESWWSVVRAQACVCVEVVVVVIVRHVNLGLHVFVGRFCFGFWGLSGMLDRDGLV